MTVVDLDSRRPKDEPVYECNMCGSQRFCLWAGGKVQCIECREFHEHLIWGQHFVSGVRPDLNKKPPTAKPEVPR